MRGSTVVITGATSGIGRATALGLAERGVGVVLACRDIGRAQALADELRERAAEVPVACCELDLASLASVRRAAEALLREQPRIDVLINNAGVFPRRETHTADGFEAQFGVNHLGHFLLTRLLVPRLCRSAPARVIHLTSMLHARGALDFGSFRGGGRYSPLRAYTQSKLANLLFSAELARRLEGRGVTSNAVHPGGIRTGITRDASALMRIVTWLFFKAPEVGAELPIRLATDPALAGCTGAYFADGEPADPAPQARDTALAARLWQVSSALCALPEEGL